MQQRLLWTIIIVFLASLCFVLGGYWADIYRKMLLVITLCVGFNFLFGVAGQIAFSHIAFYGIGAYSVVIFSSILGWPLPLAIFGAIALCGVIAIIVAFPASRLEGFYLALATLAFAQLFNVVIVQGGDVTGGPQGLSGFGQQDYFGFSFTDQSYTLVIVVLFLGTLLIITRLENSWFGRACRAVHDSPEAAEAMGVDVLFIKVAAFTLTSVLAGVAGVAYAFIDNYVNPLVFSLEPMFQLLFMIVLGGIGRTSGAIIGAIVIFLAPEIFEEWVGRYYILGVGVLVVLSILLLPKGVVELFDRLFKNDKLMRKGQK